MLPYCWASTVERHLRTQNTHLIYIQSKNIFLVSPSFDQCCSQSTHLSLSLAFLLLRSPASLEEQTWWLHSSLFAHFYLTVGQCYASFVTSVALVLVKDVALKERKRPSDNHCDIWFVLKDLWFESFLLFLHYSMLQEYGVRDKTRNDVPFDNQYSVCSSCSAVQGNWNHSPPTVCHFISREGIWSKKACISRNDIEASLFILIVSLPPVAGDRQPHRTNIQS